MAGYKNKSAIDRFDEAIAASKKSGSYDKEMTPEEIKQSKIDHEAARKATKARLRRILADEAFENKMIMKYGLRTKKKKK